jgi:branched-chain amino acid transport system ATP-binding protein
MPQDIILSTRDLTKEFGGFIAVKGVNLEVARGTIHALIGYTETKLTWISASS